jgi:YggT family protein
MIALLDTLLLILNLAQWIIIAHIIMSWLINFQVLNLRQPLVAQIWNGLSGLLEPIYSRIRARLPSLGGLDLAPLIVLIAIFFLQRLLVSNAAAFY